MQFRPVIGQHDYDTKIRNIKKFFDKGYQVKIVIRLKGSDYRHLDKAAQFLERVKIDLKPFSNVVEHKSKGVLNFLTCTPKKQKVVFSERIVD